MVKEIHSCQSPGRPADQGQPQKRCLADPVLMLSGSSLINAKGRKRRQIYKDKIIRSPFKSHAPSSAPSSGSSISYSQITSLAQQRLHHICVKCDRLHMVYLDLI